MTFTASTLLFSAPASAVNGAIAPQQNITINNKVSGEKYHPIERLNKKKAKIADMEKYGKISAQDAKKLTDEIDKKISEIGKFNSLTLKEKKNALKEKFKTRLSEKVKKGKITQDKADNIYADISKKIDEWNGSGYPFKNHRRHGNLKDKE